MLFSRPGTDTSVPTHLTALLVHLRHILAPLLPDQIHHTVFDQSLARQMILNLYPPGAGISPHVDLPGRYADGILGISLTGGCVMTFTPSHTGESHNCEGDGLDERHDLYLPPRTVYVLTHEARWDWAHGIEGREEDVVLDREGREETLLREVRVSVTFRWMKEGADLLA